MSKIDEKSLIGLVRNYPLLYDVSSPLYNDHSKKEEAWNEIACLMSAAANDCKIKWTRLRENYRKALIVRKKSIGRLKDRAVKHEKCLSFLNENISFKTVDKIISAPKITSSTESTSSPKITTKPHEIDIFFQSIAETVKKFPKKMQIQLKRQIFNVVNDAEAEIIDNENETVQSPKVSVSDYGDSGVDQDVNSFTDTKQYFIKQEMDIQIQEEAIM